jgi:AcrR family transcriptional regulator
MQTISDKKLAIFDSALELIKDHGFHGTPMSMVAKNANVAAGTIYHYFESKEQLISDLYSHNRGRVVFVVNKAINESGSYPDKFVNIWTSVYEFYIRNSNVLIFFEQFVNSPYNVDKYPNHYRGELYNFFVEGIKSGQIKRMKPEILVVLILGSISSAAKLNLFGNVPLTKKEMRQIVEVLWDGMSIR